jgi:DNA replication protein DnaD
MYNLQIVQGKGIPNDQYEGSLLQNTRDLAFYNISEGSEIILERIILPKFHNIAKHFVRETSISNYLKYRFDDTKSVKKKIYNYYNEADRIDHQGNSKNNHNNSNSNQQGQCFSFQRYGSCRFENRCLYKH